MWGWPRHDDHRARWRPNRRNVQRGPTSITVTKTAAGSPLSSVTFAYDPHGRLLSSTDARNGATVYSYYADDRLRSVTTPDPDLTRAGPGYDPQTTTYA